MLFALLRVLWVVLMVVAGPAMNPQSVLAKSDNDGFIYGRVVTDSGNEYTGFLRWGTEEAFWDDLFHTAKEDLPYMDAFHESRRHKDDDDTEIQVFKWTFKIKDGHHSGDRLFIARFGDIATIEPKGDDSAVLTMKSGEQYEVEGSSNDVGGKIHVKDQSLGEIDLRWDKIESITFMPAPAGEDPGVWRLYGTVETDAGNFEGFIQWDKQECLNTDLLDGETDEGDVSIEMGRIRSIERLGKRRSMVELKDGRELRLSGTNDVNHENRGIMVEDARYGRVTVGWDSFDRLIFADAPHSGRGYNEYKGSGWLMGTVTHRNGEQLRGRIVIDLDEAEGWEILNGTLHDIDFDIPLYLVASLKPLRYDECLVTFVNGEEITLEDGQDVTDSNAGILVIADEDSDPVYIEWEDVELIQFDRS